MQLQKPDLVKRFLDKVEVKTQAALDAGEWRSFKLLLRFLACLQDLFEGDGVFGLLEELFNKAVDLQAASPDDVWTHSIIMNSHHLTDQHTGHRT